MLNSRNRTVLLLFGILFMLINTLIIVLFLDTKLISEYDKYWWNTKIILIINGVCFGGFFYYSKIFKKSYHYKVIFNIFNYANCNCIFFYHI